MSGIGCVAFWLGSLMLLAIAFAIHPLLGLALIALALIKVGVEFT